MELVKNKHRDPQQLLSASSPSTPGAAVAAPQDKSISPVPSPPVPWAAARPPLQALQVPLQWGIQGRSRLSSTEGPKPPPIHRAPSVQTPWQSFSSPLLRVWGSRGPSFHPCEASRHRATTCHPSGSQNCGLPAPASLEAQPGSASFPGWEDAGRTLSSQGCQSPGQFPPTSPVLRMHATSEGAARSRGAPSRPGSPHGAGRQCRPSQHAVVS